jgi:gas vesicle protein
MKPRGNDIMKTAERVGWLLIGAGIGAGIALLYAPVSGEETRKLIRRKAEGARDTIAEAGEQVRDRVVEAGESVAEAARGVYRKGATMAAGAAGVIDAGRRAVKS